MFETLIPPERVARTEQQMANVLEMIEVRDREGNYVQRNGMIYAALSLAAMLGYPNGFRPDPHDVDWLIAFIDLPEAGQISFHMPRYPERWDRHSTEIKWERMRRYVQDKRR